MCRSLFVTHVDDPDTFLHTTVEDRNDVPTRQSEDRVDALKRQSPGNDLAAVDLAQGTALIQNRVQAQVYTAIQGLDLADGENRAGGEGLVAGCEVPNRHDLAQVRQDHLLLSQ